MSTTFVRPGHLHAASYVLSASTEAGLVVAPPTPDADNDGTLRLRATGIPTAAALLDVLLNTGGNPTGYTLSTGYGRGKGAGVVWKNTTDASTAYRGYIDTPHLVRVDFPVAYGTGLGKPSTPRTLANGSLGFCVGHNTAVASTFTFTSITTANVPTTTTIDSTSTTSDCQPDFVVMPDGRLIAVRLLGTALARYESGDHGATWSSSTSIGSVGANLDIVCLEYVDDLLVMVISDSGGVGTTDVRISSDGGYNWTSVETSGSTLRSVRTCVTTTGKILAISAGASPQVREIAPGGGLSTSPISSGLTGQSACKVALCTRDDGTVWAFAWNSQAATRCDLDVSVSLDGGVTWGDPANGERIVDLNSNLTGAGYRTITAGSWCGKVILLGQSLANTGSSYAIHMLTFGGWESVTEGLANNNYPYIHGFLPLDYPDALTTAWTRTDTGAGATVTNQGPLRFVSTGANATYYTAPTGVVNPTNAGGSYRIRYRCSQISGGDINNNSNGFRFTIDDGANRQGFALRVSTTQFRIVDSANNTLDTETVTMTTATEFLFAFKHDYSAGVEGRLTYWYKKDADATWTLGGSNLACPEEAATAADGLRLGAHGGAAVAGTHDTYGIWIADSAESLYDGQSNPDSLASRPLGTLADFYLQSGIHLGGRNAGGVAGDTYTVGTTYSYGKENIWRELRPSKKCHSSADNASWNVAFDAGANDTFRGDCVAVFGTNFRTATLQLDRAATFDSNAGSPDATVSLDASLTSFTVGAGVRGPGYVGPTAAPGWRQGQFRSDGDAHRYFLETGGVVYEITDNDENRIYVAGVDLSAAAGTATIFGDKMAATTAFKQYRYMRLLVGAQETPSGDNCYHVGTLIFDRAFEPTYSYDHGFVDRIEPNVELFETEAGYRSSARLGPRRHTLAIQWAPIAVAGPQTDLESRLRDFYRGVEGSHRPFMFWRDTTDVSTAMLVRCLGVYQATNVWGELTTALTRVDQLILEECN